MSVAPEPLGGGHYYVNVIDYKTSMYLRWTNTSTSHKVRGTFTAANCMTRYRPVAFFSHGMISRASGCGLSRVAQIASKTSRELLPVGQVSIIPTRKSRLSGCSKRSCPIKLVVRRGYHAPGRSIFNWCHEIEKKYIKRFVILTFAISTLSGDIVREQNSFYL